MEPLKKIKVQENTPLKQDKEEELQNQKTDIFQINFKGTNYNLKDIKIDLTYDIDEIQKQNMEKANVFLIRHALSKFNLVKRIQDYKSKSYNISHEEKQKIEHQMYQDSEFSDCLLHELGTIQAKNQIQSSHQIQNIKYIFISPLRRVLQTVEILFKDHPEKKQFKFVVIPQLTESIGWSTSVPVDTLHFIQEISKNNDFDIDISILQKQDAFKNGDLRFWALLQLVNEQEKQEILEYFKQNKYTENMEDSEIVRLMLQKYEEYFPKKIEMGKEVQIRGQRAKETIKNYLKNVGLSQPNEQNKIVIVSHAMFLNFFTCEYVDESGKPIGGIHSKNAQFYPYFNW